MNDWLVLAAVVIGLPAAWQLPRTIWPVRLTKDASRFKGLYCRYKVETFTGYASDGSESSSNRTIGGGWAHGTVTGNRIDITSIDRGHVLTTYYHDFFLTDDHGNSRHVQARNVGAKVGHGHLASAANIVHNGKQWNALLVYNHTTGTYWIEHTRRRMENADHGLTTMVIKIPTFVQVILLLGIVTAPLMLLFAVGATLQLWLFRKLGVRHLTAALESRADAMKAARAQARPTPPPAVVSPSTGVADLASQVKVLADLRQSGAMSEAEFQVAKSKILGIEEAPEPASNVGSVATTVAATPAITTAASDAGQSVSLTWSPDGQYWWDGSKWVLAAAAIPPGARVSDDRRHWWDGQAWRDMPLT